MKPGKLDLFEPPRLTNEVLRVETANDEDCKDADLREQCNAHPRPAEVVTIVVHLIGSLCRGKTSIGCT